jgi:pimeloyl-ACP methyl ester carboxylesterase
MRLTVGGVDTYAYTGTRDFDPARPTVLFVHGAGNDHSVWGLQSRYFAHHGRNAVAVDLPGHGRSAGDALDSIEALAGWLDALVASIGATQVAMVGHSMGALAVLELAGRSPAHIDRIALLGPAVPMAVSEALLDAARRDDHEAFEMIVGWAHAPAALLGGHPVPGMWMAGGAMRLLERSRHGVLAADLAACSAYANGLEAARAVDCPALIVTGQRDLMAPPKSAQALIETLRDKRHVSLPNCGHSMMAEAPDEVLDALMAFL